MRREGFVLSEAILYLLIAGVTFQILYSQLICIKMVSKSSAYDICNWYDSMDRLDEMFLGGELVSFDEHSIIFKTRDSYKYPSKKYRLEKYSDMLRITGMTMGHVPVVIKIKNCQFISKSKNEFIISIRMKDNKIYEHYVFL